MSQPTPIRLFSPFGSRDGTVLRDSRLVNGVAEKGQEGDEIWVQRRPGLGFLSLVAVGAGQGVYNWNNNIYSVFGGQLYKDGVAKGAVNATGVYSFTSCLGATPRLFLKNTLAAYYYDDGGGLVQVVDADYPATTVGGTAYLDGTIYVFDTTNHVIGSDFNDPSSWDALNTLVAQITPDQSVALAKQLVYVVALKQVSTEVFYDRGNATGSPLGPVQGSKMNVGCRAAGTVCDVSGDLAWVGTTSGGSVKVMLMSKVHGQDISTPPVERLLAPLDYSTAWSWSVEESGHKYYVVTLPGSNLTLCFDVGGGAWYLWTDGAGNYLPIVSATYNAAAQPVLQHATNGKLYTMDRSILSDEGVAIPWKCYTPNWDGGLRVAKQVGNLELIGDWASATIGVSWSDDDYQTYTTPQLVSMAQDRPMVHDGSSFRRRSWLLENSEAVFIRVKRMEPLVQAGTL